MNKLIKIAIFVVVTLMISLTVVFQAYGGNDIGNGNNNNNNKVSADGVNLHLYYRNENCTLPIHGTRIVTFYNPNPAVSCTVAPKSFTWSNGSDYDETIDGKPNNGFFSWVWVQITLCDGGDEYYADYFGPNLWLIFHPYDFYLVVPGVSHKPNLVFPW